MTDDLIETVARAIGDSADEMHVSQLKLAARAAIRAAAPLILDMAADEAEKNIHNFFNRADTVEAFARHRMQERAAIVAWLHEQWVGDATDNIDVFDMIDGIKAGEHLK